MTPTSPHHAPGPHAGLVLLCKRPALGHSKQRLAAEIGQEAALLIAEHLLQCALEDLGTWPGAKVIATDAQQHLSWSHAICPQALAMAQTEGDLGQRINHLDAQLRDLGHARLIFIGSDCPLLNEQHVHKADRLLATYDTVLFPAHDGGVVLMASRRPWPDLQHLPWSTARLGQALATLCREAGHSVISADHLGDIDHWQDLLTARPHLAQDRRPARAALLSCLNGMPHVRQ